MKKMERLINNLHHSLETEDKSCHKTLSITFTSTRLSKTWSSTFINASSDLSVVYWWPTSYCKQSLNLMRLL